MDLAAVLAGSRVAVPPRVARRRVPRPRCRGSEGSRQWLDWAPQRLGLALIANHFVKMNEENAAADRAPTQENN